MISNQVQMTSWCLRARPPRAALLSITLSLLSARPGPGLVAGPGPGLVAGLGPGLVAVVAVSTELSPLELELRLLRSLHSAG